LADILSFVGNTSTQKSKRGFENHTQKSKRDLKTTLKRVKGDLNTNIDTEATHRRGNCVKNLGCNDLTGPA
jgi:hypothetical protein